MQNRTKSWKCRKCGKRKSTKLGEPRDTGTDIAQRVRCDNCQQVGVKFTKYKPIKKEEVTDE